MHESFNINDTVRLKQAPEVEALVTGFMVRAHGHITYECMYMHHGSVERDMFPPEALQLAEPAKATLGFEPPKPRPQPTNGESRK